MLAAFDDLITDYTLFVPAPRNAAAQRKTYAAALKTLFNECDSILKEQLDKTGVQFKAANPEFYNTYKNNRIILDAAQSSTMVAGKITRSEATTIAIPGVVVTADTTTYSATSDENGGISIKNPCSRYIQYHILSSGFSAQNRK